MTTHVIHLLHQGQWAAAAALMLAVLFFLVAALRLAWADAREHRLPRRIVWPLYPVQLILLGAAALLEPAPARLLGGLLGAVGTGLLYLLVRLGSPRSLGLGDVRLAPVLGWMLGWASVPHAVAGLLGTFLLAGLWATALMAAGRATARTHIALGPWMLAATALCWLLLPLP